MCCVCTNGSLYVVCDDLCLLDAPGHKRQERTHLDTPQKGHRTSAHSQRSSYPHPGKSVRVRRTGAPPVNILTHMPIRYDQLARSSLVSAPNAKRALMGYAFWKQFQSFLATSSWIVHCRSLGDGSEKRAIHLNLQFI